MLKKLLGSIREYKKDSILAPIYVTLEVVLEVLIPFLMSMIIDRGVGEGDMPFIIRIGLILIVSTLFSLIFGALSGLHAAKASAGFAKNLRKDMYYNIQDFSFSNIDQFSTSSLITRLTTDITNVQNSYQMIIRIMVRAPLMLVFSLMMALNINSELGMVFLGAIPFLGIGLYLIMSQAFPIFQRVFRTYDKLNRVVQENLYGIRVVKSYVREEHETEKFKSVSKKSTLISQRLKKYWRSTVL